MAKESQVWHESPWTVWAVDHGVVMPKITPAKNKQEVAQLISKIQIETFENKFSQSAEEHIAEYGDLPFWIVGLAHRRYEPIFTPHRDKPLPGYIVKHDEKNFRTKVDKIARTGAWIMEPQHTGYKELHERGVWFVEKELFRSRKNRLLVYRFLGETGKTRGAVTIQWTHQQSSKHLKCESLVEGSWQVGSVLDFETVPQMPPDIKYGTDLNAWREVDGYVLNIVSHNVDKV